MRKKAQLGVSNLNGIAVPQASPVHLLAVDQHTARATVIQDHDGFALPTNLAMLARHSWVGEAVEGVLMAAKHIAATLGNNENVALVWAFNHFKTRIRHGTLQGRK